LNADENRLTIELDLVAMQTGVSRVYPMAGADIEDPFVRPAHEQVILQFAFG
jgi:hypothetical protein